MSDEQTFDVESVVAEIRSEAARRRDQGEISDEELEQLERTFRKYVADVPLPTAGEGLRHAIREAESRSFITHYVPATSRRPLVGGVKKGVRALVGWYVGAVAAQSRDFAAATLHALRTMADRVEALERDQQELRTLFSRLDDIEASITSIGERTRADSERLERRIDELRLPERLSRSERMLRHLSEKVDDAASGRAPSADAPPRSRHADTERAFDYYLFQEAHRGWESKKDEVLRRYLPRFEGHQDVLDFGCGKGQFLELLKEQGIQARGVDIHPEFVAACRERGLDVVEADGISYLRSLDAESLGGIFAGQVVEHLEPRELVAFVELAADKIRPGGVLMAETVNPTTLGSFAHAFYIDLSHDKPVHPTTMRFLMESAGFVDIEIEWMFPFPPGERLAEVPEAEAWMRTLNENISKLNELLWGPQDYAIVGRKP